VIARRRTALFLFTAAAIGSAIGVPGCSTTARNATPTPADTSTPYPTATAIPSATQVLTWTPWPTDTFTVSPTSTNTPLPTNTPTPLACGTVYSLPFSDDFEGGIPAGAWSAFGTVSSWYRGYPDASQGAPPPSNGAVCWGTNANAGLYNDSEDSSLYSPCLAVPSSGTHTFAWYQWYEIEAGWDGARIELSTNFGGSWTVVTPAGGYPDTIFAAGNQAGWPAGTPCYGSTAGGAWIQESFDLTPFDGTTVIVRFHFTSDPYVGYAGWYLDQVTAN